MITLQQSSSTKLVSIFIVDTDEQKKIITPMYPHTTVYYRGTSFGSFSNNGTTTIDPNDDPCAGYGVTWEFPKIETRRL